jgi:hypothetical protein
MSLRPPQSLGNMLDLQSGANALDVEIMGERAASLGRAGRIVEQSLADLRAFDGSAQDRPVLVRAAAEAVQNYFIQRELCGFVGHDDPIEQYAIPREVLARLGAR